MDKGQLVEAKTQYTDLKGTIAIDFAGQQDDFESYVSSIGIDIEKYNPVGISLYGSLGKIVSLNILCVEKTKYPIADGEKIPTIGIRVDDSLENFLKHIIRLEIVLHSKHNNVSDFVIEEAI